MTRWLPAAASLEAGSIDLVLILVHGMMLALFTGWTLYLGYVLIRFRRSRQPVASHAGAQGRFVTATEVLVVVAEVALLVGLALPAWSRQTSTPPANPVVIRVVAEQFVWNAHYPGPDGRFGETRVDLISPTNSVGLDRASPGGRDDIVLPNDIRVPIGRPVLIQLSSKDVIHSFGVPAMRVKQDAVPGLMSAVWFTPALEGAFDVACSQLCGMLHFRMRGVVTVTSASAFQEFVARESAAQSGR
jgi:cytochrome c oxidase subunit 2